MLFSKYTALEQQGAAERERLQRRVAELESKLEEQERSGDTAAEVRSRVKSLKTVPQRCVFPDMKARLVCKKLSGLHRVQPTEHLRDES